LIIKAGGILLRCLKNSGYITAGHGRLEAALLNGWDEVPVNFQGYESTEQEYADVQADNAIASWAELDMSKINIDIQDLGPELDVDMLGIKDFAIEPADKYADKDADAIPENVETICKLGDLWQLGNHRLYCGDCTVKENVDKLMDGNKADMVFTDPPYGVSYAEKNVFLNTITFGNRLEKNIENDDKPVKEMFELWKSVFEITANASNDKASYYICSPQGGELMMMMMMQAIDQSPWHLKHTLIWNKNNHVLGRCDYHYKHEPILYGWKKKGTHNFYGNGELTKSVWDIKKPHNSDLHPTMKPIELMENAIKNSSLQNNNILDIFGGSGSTLIACEKTNRKCFMMELDEHYCDVIIKRYEDFTGNKAVKL